MCYGSEFTSNANLSFADRMLIDSHYIAPGTPIQNAFIESFNGQANRDALGFDRHQLVIGMAFRRRSA